MPEWMCTFGDMMSLLLCFFIMLFSLSIITPIRYQALVDTFQQEFGYAGSSKAKIQGKQTTTTVSESAAKNRRISAFAGGQPIPGPQGLSTEIHTIVLDGETIKNGLIRFELGSDQLSEQAKWELRAALPILQNAPQKIMILGYAAPAERSEDYQQNTSLPFLRALAVVDYLVSLGLDRDFFEIWVDPHELPRRNVLPAGMDPDHAGASVEIILLNQTVRTGRS